MQQKYLRKHCAGFTVIELSIVLLIIGIIFAPLVNAYGIYMKKQREESMKERISDIKLALTRYVDDDPDDPNDPVRFPCPASLTAKPGDPDFGKEICPTGSITVGQDLGGVYVLNGTNTGTFALIGTVPTSTIGAPADLMSDEYGNRLTYAVTYDLTLPDALAKKPVAQGEITILGDNESPAMNHADFFIVSHGEDGAGAYTTSGEKNGNPCRQSAHGDALNCQWQNTYSAIFAERGLMGASSANNDNYFDDHTMFNLGDYEGWWYATNISGENIANKNIGNVTINGKLGVMTMPSTAALEVKGDTLVTGNSTISGTSVVKGDITGNNFVQSDVAMRSNAYCNRDGSSCLSFENINGVVTCNKKSQLYNPDSQDADSDGCVPIFSNDRRLVVEKTLCTRGGVHTLTATCPSGYSLIACSGGPGDQDEYGEGWYIKPNTSSQSCTLLIGKPACIASSPWTHTHVFAHCLKSE